MKLFLSDKGNDGSNINLLKKQLKQFLINKNKYFFFNKKDK